MYKLVNVVTNIYVYIRIIVMSSIPICNQFCEYKSHSHLICRNSIGIDILSQYINFYVTRYTYNMVHLMFCSYSVGLFN